MIHAWFKSEDFKIFREKKDKINNLVIDLDRNKII